MPTQFRVRKLDSLLAPSLCDTVLWLAGAEGGWWISVYASVGTGGWYGFLMAGCYFL